MKQLLWNVEDGECWRNKVRFAGRIGGLGEVDDHTFLVILVFFSYIQISYCSGETTTGTKVSSCLHSI